MRVRTTDEIAELARRSFVHNYDPLPVAIDDAEGVWLRTRDGKRILDCFSMYSVANFGYKNPKLLAALMAQALKISVCSPIVLNEVTAVYSRKLCDLTGKVKELPAITGAEAVEKGVKIVRRWGYEVKGVQEDSAEIVVCTDNFHGRTIAALSASTNEKYRRNFGPFVPGFVKIPFNNAGALVRAITSNTVAFMVEPIQGEGGIHVPRAGYFAAVKEICASCNVLLAFDEIQTGMGRTGDLFAYHHEGVEPDLFFVGKALGAGYLPISAVVGDRKVMELIGPGDDGTTFARYPLACAVAIAAMEMLSEGEIVGNARRVGGYFLSRLRELRHPVIKEVRGRGLLIGVEFHEHVSAREVEEKLLGAGVLSATAGEHVLRLSPPLIITKEEVDFAVEQIDKVAKIFS